MEDTSQYTVDQAAQILELSPACVRQMLRAGELEGERREEHIEGVLGPWRIPERAVHDMTGQLRFPAGPDAVWLAQAQ